MKYLRPFYNKILQILIIKVLLGLLINPFNTICLLITKVYFLKALMS
jgi:hypothetical protein